MRGPGARARLDATATTDASGRHGPADGRRAPRVPLRWRDDPRLRRVATRTRPGAGARRRPRRPRALRALPRRHPSLRRRGLRRLRHRPLQPGGGTGPPRHAGRVPLDGWAARRAHPRRPGRGRAHARGTPPGPVGRGGDHRVLHGGPVRADGGLHPAGGLGLRLLVRHAPLRPADAAPAAEPPGSSPPASPARTSVCSGSTTP